MLDDRVAALKADHARGSAALADEALAILGEAARQLAGPGFLEDLDALAARLARARPTMVAIENRLAHVLANVHAADAPPESLPTITEGLVEAMRARAPREREEAAKAAAAALGSARRILTVSWSDTAARALELAQARAPRQVVVGVGWPLRDGQRAAERLALAGLDVEVVPDNAVGYAALDCDVAIVGADAILGSGVVVNRAGTSLAALAMATGARPVWVVAEQAKVTWRAAVPLEEGPPQDVATFPPLLPGKVRHPLFDATPAELIRGYCTEQGTLPRAALAGIAERHRRRAAWAEP